MAARGKSGPTAGAASEEGVGQCSANDGVLGSWTRVDMGGWALKG
jgi:hypothetical protein